MLYYTRRPLSGPNACRYPNGGDKDALSTSPSSISPLRISYSRYFLMNQRYSYNHVDSEVCNKLKSLNLLRYRGKRSGTKHQRNILRQVTSQRKQTTNAVEQLNQGSIRSNSQLITINRAKKSNPRINLPKLFLSNPQSLTNVFDEFVALIKQIKPHIISISETWFSINKPASEYNINRP